MTDLAVDDIPKNDQVRVTILTNHHILTGDVHLPKTGKEDRRLTTLLNSDRKFIAITSVEVKDRLTRTKDPQTYPFIQVSLNAIELIKPH